MEETWVWSLGQEDPLEKETATHSSILAWKIPWTVEPDGLQSMGSQKSQTQLSDYTIIEGQRGFLHLQCDYRNSLIFTELVGYASSSYPPPPAQILCMDYGGPPVWIAEGASIQWDQKIYPGLSIPGGGMNPLTPGSDLWPQVTWDWGS